MPAGSNAVLRSTVSRQSRTGRQGLAITTTGLPRRLHRVETAAAFASTAMAATSLFRRCSEQRHGGSLHRAFGMARWPGC
jgi:hypothetical protein